MADLIVASGGSDVGAGTLSNPLSIAAMLSQSASVPAGTRYLLRGGPYGSSALFDYKNPCGTLANPIVVSNYPGERARLDGWVYIDAPHVTFQGIGLGLEIYRSNPIGIPGTNGPQDQTGFYVFSDDVKLRGCVLHDHLGDAVGAFNPATNFEMFGNVLYNNGFNGTPTTPGGADRGHGQGIYTQNLGPSSTKLLKRNIAFAQFSQNFQLYTASGNVDYFTVDGNILFLPSVRAQTTGGTVSNILVSPGGQNCRSIVIQNNVLYAVGTPAETVGQAVLGGIYPNIQDITSSNNIYCGTPTFEYWATISSLNDQMIRSNGYAVFGVIKQATPLSNWQFTNLRIRGLSATNFGAFKIRVNDGSDQLVSETFYSLADAATAGFQSGGTSSTAALTGYDVNVYPLDFETGRAHVSVLNWELKSTAPVPLSGIGLTTGDTFYIYAVEDLWPEVHGGTPVYTGTYDAANPVINLPMVARDLPHPLGARSDPPQPPPVGPEFGAFVVTKNKVQSQQQKYNVTLSSVGA